VFVRSVILANDWVPRELWATHRLGRYFTRVMGKGSEEVGLCGGITPPPPKPPDVYVDLKPWGATNGGKIIIWTCWGGGSEEKRNCLWVLDFLKEKSKPIIKENHKPVPQGKETMKRKLGERREESREYYIMRAFAYGNPCNNVSVGYARRGMKIEG